MPLAAELHIFSKQQKQTPQSLALRGLLFILAILKTCGKMVDENQKVLVNSQS